MAAPPVKSNTRHERRLHPLPVRIMHWINAVAIFIMIGSGWKIYNDDVIFGFLHFPDALVIGKWAQYGLQWHFFGMWIFVINGLAYLIYGIATGRFRQKLFPLSLRDILATVGDALRFRLAHEDLTHYNAVQKILYLGIMAVGVLIVISGLALWKPVQFSELASLFGSFQTIRLVHFLCMTAIVCFLLVHVTLALLVPQSLVAMLTGGPAVDDKPAAADAAAEAALPDAVTSCLRTRTPSLFRPQKPIDQTRADATPGAGRDINRRSVLRGAISLGALTLLTGCDVSEEDPVQKVLRAVSAWNDRVQAAIFRPDHLAPTFSAAQVVKPPRFNAYYDIEDVKPVDGATWKLELAGLIDDKRPWTAQQIYAAARAGNHHPPHLRRGLGLHRPMVRPEPERLPAARRRRSDREIRLFPLRRRLHREHRHGDGAASADHPRHQICRRRRSPIRSAIRCGCAPRPSSATRTPSGSRRSR